MRTITSSPFAPSTSATTAATAFAWALITPWLLLATLRALLRLLWWTSLRLLWTLPAPTTSSTWPASFVAITSTTAFLPALDLAVEPRQFVLTHDVLVVR